MRLQQLEARGALQAAKWVARTNYLPVLTAGQQPVFKSDAAALNAMCSSNFNPRTTVFLPESARQSVNVSNETVCAVQRDRYRQNEVEADVAAAAPSMVVLSQTYYHLWRAEVDGQRVPLFRANLAFQALQAPAGAHHVRLSYHDPLLALGAGASAVSLLVCIVLWRVNRKVS